MSIKITLVHCFLIGNGVRDNSHSAGSNYGNNSSSERSTRERTFDTESFSSRSRLLSAPNAIAQTQPVVQSSSQLQSVQHNQHQQQNRSKNVDSVTRQEHRTARSERKNKRYNDVIIKINDQNKS